MTATLDALWLAVEQSPDDWQRYLVLADALNDAGEERLEKAARWMVIKRKRPMGWQIGDRRMWVWHKESCYPELIVGRSEMLSDELFDKHSLPLRCLKSFLAAVSWLADQLERVQ